jgi:alkylhydroperoxidase/carboxymuconolactone decarboxylase family protein YurZ
MADEAKEAFKKVGLGSENNAYDIIAKLDPEYFEKLKGLYVDGTFGREGALPRKTKELIMVGICCALLRPRGIRLHSERALTLGATPKEVMEAMEVAAIPGGLPGLGRHRVQMIKVDVSFEVSCRREAGFRLEEPGFRHTPE